MPSLVCARLPEVVDDDVVLAAVVTALDAPVYHATAKLNLIYAQAQRSVEIL